MIRTRWLLVLASLMYATLLPRVHADGGTMRVSERRGDYRISAFTAPTPLRAGPVDFSVLVQDARTGALLPQADVMIQATPRDSPDERLVQRATREAATNKLLHAAQFELSEAGWWEIEIVVAGGKESARVRFEVQAAQAPPRWLALWPWLGWPAVIVGLFCVHQTLVRRRARRHAAAIVSLADARTRPNMT